MYQIYSKQGLDVFLIEMGRMMAETIMYIDREEIVGPDYQPFSSNIQKWANQPGSISAFMGYLKGKLSLRVFVLSMLEKTTPSWMRLARGTAKRLLSALVSTATV